MNNTASSNDEISIKEILQWAENDIFCSDKNVFPYEIELGFIPKQKRIIYQILQKMKDLDINFHLKMGLVLKNGY